METIQKHLNIIRNIGEKIAVIWTDEDGVLFHRILDEHIKNVEDVVSNQRAGKEN